MPIRSVLPEEAQALLDEGWVYVDVRTEEEFAEGHPPGALNLPVSFAGGGGMVPNPEFLSVAERVLGKGEKLVLGCRSGVRSRRAAEMLEAAGYQQLADLVTGWAGSRDAFGRPRPGWLQSGLAVETGTPGESGYAHVQRRTPR